METVYHNSPLGDYLKGEGEALSEQSRDTANQYNDNVSFAPSSDIHNARKPRRLIHPILRSNAVSRMRLIYAAIVNATLGNNNNDGFLEYFRYQIIASQLLGEDTGAVTSPTAPRNDNIVHINTPEPKATTTGAGIAAAIAFSLALAWRWAIANLNAYYALGRVLIATTFTAACIACIWVYTTRQSILALRRKVLECSSAFTVNLQSLNSASVSVLSMIQEIELVSRGYRLSHPLPPITRLDVNDESRKTFRLRKALQASYATLNPLLISVIEDTRPLADPDDVSRFLDVYEIRSEDVDDALRGYDPATENDTESLKSLKIYQARFSALRRLLLCLLLSLQATGRRADVPKWLLVVNVLQHVGDTSGDAAQRLIQLLDNNEQPPTPVTNRRRTIGARDSSAQHSRVESQVRRISTLSTSIRSLQAKLYLLREDSTRALSTSTSERELLEVSQSLNEQYDGLGIDLQALLQAWEAGKEALAKDISRHGRRISQPSSPDPRRSISRPETPDTGLATVSEVKSTTVFTPVHGPGRAPLSPPVTDDGSDEANLEDEIFEAVSSPRTRERSTLTPEERIAKAKDERERLLMATERRDARASMVQELQSVIKLRPAVRNRRHDIHNRVTSL